MQILVVSTLISLVVSTNVWHLSQHVSTFKVSYDYQNISMDYMTMSILSSLLASESTIQEIMYNVIIVQIGLN